MTTILKIAKWIDSWELELEGQHGIYYGIPWFTLTKCRLHWKPERVK